MYPEQSVSALVAKFNAAKPIGSDQMRLGMRRILTSLPAPLNGGSVLPYEALLDPILDHVEQFQINSAAKGGIAATAAAAEKDACLAYLRIASQYRIDDQFRCIGNDAKNDPLLGKLRIGKNNIRRPIFGMDGTTQINKDTYRVVNHEAIIKGYNGNANAIDKYFGAWAKMATDGPQGYKEHLPVITSMQASLTRLSAPCT